MKYLLAIFLILGLSFCSKNKLKPKLINDKIDLGYITNQFHYTNATFGIDYKLPENWLVTENKRFGLSAFSNYDLSEIRERMKKGDASKVIENRFISPSEIDNENGTVLFFMLKVKKSFGINFQPEDIEMQVSFSLMENDSYDTEFMNEMNHRRANEHDAEAQVLDFQTLTLGKVNFTCVQHDFKSFAGKQNKILTGCTSVGDFKFLIQISYDKPTDLEEIKDLFKDFSFRL
jgi:hypothetical protein